MASRTRSVILVLLPAFQADVSVIYRGDGANSQRIVLTTIPEFGETRDSFDPARPQTDRFVYPRSRDASERDSRCCACTGMDPDGGEVLRSRDAHCGLSGHADHRMHAHPGVATGGFALYNTTVLNSHLSGDERLGLWARNEKTYGKFAAISQQDTLAKRPDDSKALFRKARGGNDGEWQHHAHRRFSHHWFAIVVIGY